MAQSFLSLMSGVADPPPRSPCWSVWIASWRRWRLVCWSRIARAQAGVPPVSPPPPRPPDDGDGEFWLRASHADCRPLAAASLRPRSEEHTSELQSLMRISYAVFCLKKNNHKSNLNITIVYVNS